MYLHLGPFVNISNFLILAFDGSINKKPSKNPAPLTFSFLRKGNDGVDKRIELLLKYPIDS